MIKYKAIDIAKKMAKEDLKTVNRVLKELDKPDCYYCDKDAAKKKTTHKVNGRPVCEDCWNDYQDFLSGYGE